MSVNATIDLEMECDKCGKHIYNHYSIESEGEDLSTDKELEKLAELNDWKLDDDGKDLCPNCQVRG